MKYSFLIDWKHGFSSCGDEQKMFQVNIDFNTFLS
jgi:hypothetical protein